MAGRRGVILTPFFVGENKVFNCLSLSIFSSED